MRRCGGVDDDADALLSFGARGTSDESTRRRFDEDEAVESAGAASALDEFSAGEPSPLDDAMAVAAVAAAPRGGSVE